MPTPKQVKHHYKRIHRLSSKLMDSLYDAEKAKVTVYTDWSASPQVALEKTKEAILITTEKARARAVHDECAGEK